MIAQLGPRIDNQSESVPNEPKGGVMQIVLFDSVDIPMWDEMMVAVDPHQCRGRRMMM